MGSICEQLAVVTTAEEGLRGRNVLSIDFYYTNCSQILLVLVGGLVGYLNIQYIRMLARICICLRLFEYLFIT